MNSAVSPFTTLIFAMTLGFSSFSIAASQGKKAEKKDQSHATSTSSMAQVEKNVYFENLKDGDRVKSPFIVKMGVKGKKLRDAGQDPNDKTTGHHHILVDRGFVPADEPIPMNEQHLHYGKSQAEATVTLPPGPHTLTLQFADGVHRSYGEAYSNSIKVIVE